MLAALMQLIISTWQRLFLRKLKVVPLSFVPLSLALVILPACSDAYAATRCEDALMEGERYEVSMKNLSPSPVQEGGRLAIGVGISPTPPEGCEWKIHGGVRVFDTYNDHEFEDGHLLADELIAVAFWAGQSAKTVTYGVPCDGVSTPRRRITVDLHPGWETHLEVDPTRKSVSVSDSGLSPNPPKDADGRREDRGRGDEGATGGMAWAPLG